MFFYECAPVWLVLRSSKFRSVVYSAILALFGAILAQFQRHYSAFLAPYYFSPF